MEQNNLQYIRQWLLEHNDYLEFRLDCEEMLEILTRFVVIFEKLQGVPSEDIIIKEGTEIRMVGGPAQTDEKANFLLKLVNYVYGYLPLEVIKKVPGYAYLRWEEDGVFSQECLEDNCLDWVQRTMGYYGKLKFDRIVYIIKNKVFYADQPLTEEEISYIEKHERGDQVRYDVDHDEHGMCWW